MFNTGIMHGQRAVWQRVECESCGSATRIVCRVYNYERKKPLSDERLRVLTENSITDL